MKKKTWDDPEFIEQFKELEAQSLKSEKKKLPTLLADLSQRLQQLMENHPKEYWEAVITMDPIPTLLPRKPAAQKAWHNEHIEKGILLKGKRGRFFDPTSPINQDVIEAYEAVQSMQFQWKNHDDPYSQNLKALEPLSEDNTSAWTRFIVDAYMALHKGRPEHTAHAAKCTRHRVSARKSPTDADIRNELIRDLKAALKVFARDLDRSRL
tara:strand:+ start:286 stop:915 length:630 start_codon:yes stop_codon:yes gene_type:complete